jgi:2-iminobutanoate/2-iminopropanoate deaminase
VDPQTGEIRAGLEAQTAQALENLRAVVEEADGTLDDVCKTTCFLADIGDFAVFNSVYAAVFGERLPARSTFGVALAPGLLVEIEAVVFVGRG